MVPKSEIVKKLAQEFDCVFVPLQEKFDKACEKAPATYWIGDGVHPTLKGHQLIKEALIEEINKII